jgi:hypothetical protein
MKLRNPAAESVVGERNRPDDTFGWGVVLSDETLTNLAALAARISPIGTTSPSTSRTRRRFPPATASAASAA